MSKFIKGKTYFNDSWLINKEYSEWIKKCDSSELAFYCSWCCKKVKLSNKGEKAVRNHMNRDTHKNALKRIKSTRSINSFFSSSSQPSSSKTSNITVPADAVCAEIIWGLTVAQKNFQQIPVMILVKLSKKCFQTAKFIATLPWELKNVLMSLILD